jgi:formylglycine-generating enzyme required for sulfatase activity
MSPSSGRRWSFVDWMSVIGAIIAILGFVGYSTYRNLLPGRKDSTEAEKRAPAVSVRQDDLQNQPNSRGATPQSDAALPVIHEITRSPGTRRTNVADGLSYVWVPPGTFTIGCSPKDASCEPNELHPHRVTITQGFWIGETEVPEAAWKRVLNVAIWFGARGDDYPIASATFLGASKYCLRVNGRLPSEAEWEYAARAGNESARYGRLEDIAWFGENNLGERTIANAWASNLHVLRNEPLIQPVKKKEPNAWGVYDMLGNVMEWVADFYQPSYSSTPQTNPTGPENGSARVLRGGSWNSGRDDVRASYRLPMSIGSDQDSQFPAFHAKEAGFRCVLDQ